MVYSLKYRQIKLGWLQTLIKLVRRRRRTRPRYPSQNITKDLTPFSEKPLWPLSSYGPSKSTKTLIGGLDESQEEMRYNATQAVASGNIEAYKQYEAQKIAAAEQVMKNALANVNSLYDQAVKQFNGDTNPPTTNTFSNAPVSVFGQTSAPTAPKPSPFGSASQGSVFGQPSTGAFGTAAPSSFIKPATAGVFGSSTTPSAFGSSAFGSPSTFGSSSFPSTTGTSTIAPSSPFGAFSNAGKPTVFGQPSAPTPASSSVFGSASTSTPPTAPASVFGSGGSGFGNTGQTPIQPRPFGAPAPSAPFGSPFSQAQPQASAPAQAPSSVFGTPSAFPSSSTAFGQTPAPSTSVFGQTAPAPPTNNVFGQPSNTTTSSVFGQPAPPPQPAASPFAPIPSQPPPPPPAAAAPRPTTQFIPASDPYIATLPKDYLQSLPKEVRAAFESDSFDWNGLRVPEWVPPTELR
ncbi:hypothetical protein SISNIDRAFT_487682 [Sistotremastrum niveocremeum HHB9708]|uniref:Uncharacterized protein n=1 Tax=Sistotremastrum niveocremeum HHB9708 TaxID=1314777 RepID=A0A164SD42_9AGAM|nr:hypothetical protein SISNIDRAFT_487682 [Sistotremastrum niveocremeum HHB9708]